MGSFSKQYLMSNTKDIAICLSIIGTNAKCAGQGMYVVEIVTTIHI